MNLREARKLRNVSQMELQEKCGIWQTHLSQHESGKRPLDKSDQRKIESYLNLRNAIDWNVAHKN